MSCFIGRLLVILPRSSIANICSKLAYHGVFGFMGNTILAEGSYSMVGICMQGVLPLLASLDRSDVSKRGISCHVYYGFP